MIRRFASVLSLLSTTVRQGRKGAVGVAIVLGALAVAKPSQAQEIQLTGPLAGAPATRHLRLHREGHLEVAPTVSFSLLDEYRRSLIAGGRIQYNLKDWISVGVWGGYNVFNSTTDLTDQIDVIASRNPRTAANVAPAGKFKDQTAKLGYFIAPQVQFSPFRGKLALFQKIFVDTDLYLHGGVAFVGVDERGECGTAGKPVCSDPKSFALASRTAIAPTFGLGLNLYASNLISIGLEYRAIPFSWNRAGFDTRGAGNNSKFPDNKIDSQDQTFKFNQMVTLAVGFTLGSVKTSE